MKSLRYKGKFHPHQCEIIGIEGPKKSPVYVCRFVHSEQEFRQNKSTFHEQWIEVKQKT